MFPINPRLSVCLSALKAALTGHPSLSPLYPSPASIQVVEPPELERAALGVWQESAQSRGLGQVGL